MKININGVTRDMTPEEEAEYNRIMAEMPAPKPSLEEQLEKLKIDFELMEV